MSISNRILSLILLIPLIWVSAGYGQSASDVLRYSLQYPSYDAASMVMPGVSNATGFGAYQENPASMALFEDGFISFSLNSRLINETTNYLGNSSEFNDNQTTIGDLGFLYRVPTTRGSLVVGAGYSQSMDFNRAFSGGGRNSQSTITDFYNSPLSSDSLFFAAFDVYAIDFATTDSSFSETESIFRVGLSQYPGINQNFEVKERGILGDYSAFIATEFQEDLFIGVSLGYLSGSYSYRRSFLETDTQGDYNFAFIDSDGDGQGDTDIDNILSKETIDAELSGFTARAGLVYNASENVRIGVSYQYAGKLSIDEEYNTQLTSTFDNGVEFFDEAPGSFSYKIKRPDRINLGITLKGFQGFKISAAAEGVRYSTGRIEFSNIQDSGAENDINDVVRSNLEDVVNLRGGIEYQLNPLLTTRIGYAYFPSPQKNFDSSRQFFSGGFSAQLFDNVTFDLGVQYSIWEDSNQLYSYFEGNQLRSEAVIEDVTRWNVIGGIKIGF
ncbi:MAG: outer membrane protein transport protein [Balneolaceae bacterium]|nr:outer membrane protein transport protein [Balneolaceae bacterium]